MSYVFHAMTKIKIMKTIILPLFLFFSMIRPLPAQTDAVVLKSYRVWVVPMKHARNIEGILYETRDSSVLVSGTSLKNSSVAGVPASCEIWSKDIKEIDLVKKGAHGTAILIGTAAGAVAGLLIGLLTGIQSSNKEANQHFESGALVVFPLLGAGIGAGIGGTVGGKKIKIPIKGNQAELELNRYRLESYSLKKHTCGNKPGGVYFSRLKDTLTDVDGHVYSLLALGGQVWMASNLKAIHFRDSSEIPGTSVRKLTNEIQYNWTAINDVRKICPAGWHVPAQAEWTSFCNSLGGSDNAAGILEGDFTPKGWTAQWWSSTVHPENAGCFYIDGTANRAAYTVQPKTSFLSVRCIRDN